MYLLMFLSPPGGGVNPDQGLTPWLHPIVPTGLTSYRRQRSFTTMTTPYSIKSLLTILTLKASDTIAQGQRSGAAVERHPGYRFQNMLTTL